MDSERNEYKYKSFMSGNVRNLSKNDVLLMRESTSNIITLLPHTDSEENELLRKDSYIIPYESVPETLKTHENRWVVVQIIAIYIFSALLIAGGYTYYIIY